MKYDPNKHHRRSIRLKGYDYAQAGAYFVTICTRARECVLDDPVVSGIITDVWHALPAWFPTIALDEFVVMPNHVHLIVWLNPPPDDVGATLAVAPDEIALDAVAHDGARAGIAPMDWVIPKAEKVNLKPRLGDVMGSFQSLVFTVYLDWIEKHSLARRAKFWQRNYYDHIVRNDRELNAIRHYIQDNPKQWALDRDNADNLRHLPFPTQVEEYLEDVQALFKDD